MFDVAEPTRVSDRECVIAVMGDNFEEVGSLEAKQAVLTKAAAAISKPGIADVSTPYPFDPATQQPVATTPMPPGTRYRRDFRCVSAM